MSWQMASLLLLGGSTILLFVGIPVAFSFIAINLIIARAVSRRRCRPAPARPQQQRRGAQLFADAHPAVHPDGRSAVPHRVGDQGHRRHRTPDQASAGRLAVVAVVAGTVFSAISGSTIATTAMLGSLMLPIMLARGYHPTMATGPIMAIGAVDMLIPPSALTVLLGSLSGISISKLLIGGSCRPDPQRRIRRLYHRPRAWPIRRSLRQRRSISSRGGPIRSSGSHVLPLVSIFVVVIGAMSGGIATPTESAALGALATMALAAVYGALSFAAVAKALHGTIAISGMILFHHSRRDDILADPELFRATEGIVSAVLPAAFSLRDPRGMMGAPDISRPVRRSGQHDAITLPVFMPIVQRLNIDPIWFGVLYLICMQLGLLLPPHGLLLMTMRGVAPPQVTMADSFPRSCPNVCEPILLAVIAMFPRLPPGCRLARVT